MRETRDIVVKPDSIVRFDDAGHIIRSPTTKWPKAQDGPVYMLSQSYDASTRRTYSVLTAWDGHNGELLYRGEVEKVHYSTREGTMLVKIMLSRWMATEKGYPHEH